jgi:hypothetical protein
MSQQKSRASKIITLMKLGVRVTARSMAMRRPSNAWLMLRRPYMITPGHMTNKALHVSTRSANVNFRILRACLVNAGVRRCR